MAAKTWAGGGAVAAGQRQPLQQKGFLLEAIIRERGRREPGSNVVEDEVEAAPSATTGICFARWRWLPFLFAFVVEREGSAAWSGVGCSQKGFAWFLPCCLHFNKQHKIFSTINRPKCNAPGHIANCAQKTTQQQQLQIRVQIQLQLQQANCLRGMLCPTSAPHATAAFLACRADSRQWPPHQPIRRLGIAADCGQCGV